MPITIAGVVALGILPTIIWLVFFEYQHKRHPLAFQMVVFSLILGALVTFFALVLQYYLDIHLFSIGYGRHHSLVIILFSAIEEVLKFLAVFLLVRPNKHFKEPLDAMLYMIIVGLGFAAVENVATLFNYGGDLATIFTSAKAFEIVTLRFMGATLLHALAGAVIGYHWAIGLVRKKAVALHIIVGLLIATLLHAIFNYLIMNTGPSSWVIVYLIAVMFFVLVDFEEIKAVDKDPQIINT